MSSCTIYIKEVTASDACSVQIIARASELGVRVHTMTKASSPTEWTRVIVGSHNFVRRMPESPSRQSVLEHLMATSIVVGIPDAPGNSDVERYRALSLLVDGMCALFFDGFTFRDSDGVDMLRSNREQAEPGATDNPDDAQRLREDH